MRIAGFLFALALLGLVACSDDGTTPGDDFSVRLRVVDQEGDPVPNLDLLLVMDSPFYQDGFAAGKAAVAFGWMTDTPGRVDVTVEDAAGAVIRHLYADTLRVGASRIMWDGRDDEGQHQYSGLYWACAKASFNDGALIEERREPMFLAILDFDQATLGTTNSFGEIYLKDKRLFPRLYGEVAMGARDENGDSLGSFPLVNETRFYLWDRRGSGHGEHFIRAVTGSGQLIEYTWSGVFPAPAAAPAPGPAPAPAPAAKRAGPWFQMEPPYPNPFN